jgi:uncharacterized iron-regulated membrane protein
MWQQWLRQPQGLLFRKVLFQIHLWSGLSVGLYVLVVSVTGSVLVYRNELYTAFSPEPVIVQARGNAPSAGEITTAAERAYPGHLVTSVEAGETEQQAVQVTLGSGDDMIRRLFHPYTGEDLGDPLPVGFRFTRWLLDLHDNLLAGPTGRRVNGVGAVLLLVLCATGAVIWWPGIKHWRRSLTLDRTARTKRLSWHLHSLLGFWSFIFLVMWGLTGAYLAFPELFAAGFDYLEPFDENSPAERVGDRIQYWLGYLHFGRLGGRGIPGCGRGLCNSMTKLIWALVALVPPVMVITGVTMWWKRAVRSGKPTRTSAPAVPRIVGSASRVP